MRHRKGFNHLGRTSAHRKAMLSNMASSLILHKRITTTSAKAKALRTYVEPLITKSKNDTTHSRRVVFSYLKNKYAVSELFREVSPKIMERPGGYTRILKTGNRLGDNAEMCIIELVDYNENMLEDKTAKAKPSRRRRGSGKKKAESEAAETGTREEGTENVAADEDMTASPVQEEESPAKEAAEEKPKAGEAAEEKPETSGETEEKAEAKEETDEKAEAGEKSAGEQEGSDKEADKKE